MIRWLHCAAIASIPRQHFFRRLLGRQAAAVGAVQLIGGQVAQIFQQGGALLRQADKMQVLGTFHGSKLFLRPHGAVFGHPRGALGVPHLHGGKVIARAPLCTARCSA